MLSRSVRLEGNGSPDFLGRGEYLLPPLSKPVASGICTHLRNPVSTVHSSFCCSRSFLTSGTRWEIQLCCDHQLINPYWPFLVTCMRGAMNTRTRTPQFFLWKLGEHISTKMYFLADSTMRCSVEKSPLTGEGSSQRQRGVNSRPPHAHPGHFGVAAEGIFRNSTGILSGETRVHRACDAISVLSLWAKISSAEVMATGSKALKCD
jgi:hypothetical protein